MSILQSNVWCAVSHGTRTGSIFADGRCAAGTLQLDMGCLTEAGTNLQRSFDIRAKLLGEENPRTQVSWAQTLPLPRY